MVHTGLKALDYVSKYIQVVCSFQTTLMLTGQFFFIRPEKWLCENTSSSLLSEIPAHVALNNHNMFRHFNVFLILILGLTFFKVCLRSRCQNALSCCQMIG
ncbi:hypothetical protein ATANTOWER_001017 [Ataeniobius toweri]|uniref:Uncharacterized protein n=1 Tax=Ataeniobius toweri TaxID=208326 RepID=A0ABU7CDT4_9TELE|nr:hypothetical protein [Ataeniobius toweri]